MKSDIAGREKS